MRQLPLVGLLLLVPESAISAAHYHVHSTTYACVDPKVALSPDNAALREQGRCFRVHPRERLEQISRPSRSLRLMRIKPPHIGEPPLYFRASSVTPFRLHHGTHAGRRHAGRWRHLRSAGLAHGRADASRMPEISELSAATVAPEIQAPPVASALVMPPAAQVAPVPVSLPVAAPVPKPAPVAPSAPLAAHVAAPVQKPAPHTKNAGRFNHVFAALLLWALIVAGAALLVRIALIRKQHPAPVPRPQLQEPVWTPNMLWHEARLEPVVERLPVAAGLHDATSEPDQPEKLEAGAVGFTSNYSIVRAAVSGEPQQNGVLPAELSDYKNRCVAGLRHAGWDARTRFSAGLPGPDVIARSGGLVMALRCLPSSEPVDAEAVRDACLVRDSQRSDLAAIVSNGTFTEAAKQLAARTGIVLLHENELASFAA